MTKRIAVLLTAALLWSAGPAPVFAAQRATPRAERPTIPPLAPRAAAPAAGVFRPASVPGAAAAIPQSARALPVSVLPAAAEAAPAYSFEAAAAAEPRATGFAGLLQGLRAAVTGRSSSERMFDAAADRREASGPVGAMGLRPLSQPSLPQGTKLDAAPTTPANAGVRRLIRAMNFSRELKADPTSEQDVERALRQVIERESQMFEGVKSADLQTVHVRRIEGYAGQADTFYAVFRQQQAGLVVDGSQISFMIKVIKGKPVIVDAEARVFPPLGVNAGQTLSDDELKQRAERKLNLPQSAGVEYGFLERKILFVGNAWRAVNVYAVDGAVEYAGLMVAVDVATGETFAWDARRGVAAGVPAAPRAERQIVMFKSALSAAQIAAAKDAYAKAGLTVLDTIAGSRMGTVMLVVGSLKDVEAVTPAVNAAVDAAGKPSGASVIAMKGRGEAKEARPAGQPELVDLPLPHLSLTVDTEKLMTDADGRVGTNAVGQLKAVLTGKWAVVNDQNRKPVQISAVIQNGDNVVIAPAAQNDLTTINQINMYVWITKIHDWWSERIKGDKRIDRQLPVNVNINQDCNAYYTPGRPTVNFFKESRRCSDTGRPGIGAHEYGHFVDDMLGGIINGGLSEGWGDIGSMFLLGSPVIGDGFLKGQNPSYIRHGENNYQYRKWDQVHDQGQAWMGFAWKLRQSLIAKLGEAEGSKVADAMIVPTILSKASDIPGQIAKVLLNSQDKDGKTLHEKEIRDAAKAHGIDLPGKRSEVSPLGWLGSWLAPKTTFKAEVTGASAAITLTGGRAALDALAAQIETAVERRHMEHGELRYKPFRTGGMLSEKLVVVLSGDPEAVAFVTEQIKRLADPK